MISVRSAFLFFCLSAALLGATATRPAFDIPQLNGVKIDGDSGDWHDNGFRVAYLPCIIGSPGEGRDDFSPAMRLAWNATGLMVLVRVLDDDIREEQDVQMLYNGDGMELFIARKPGLKGGYQVEIGTGADRRYPEPRHFFFAHRTEEESRHGLSIEKAAKKIPGGYLLEVLLPWKNLNMSAREGDTIGFQIYANDRDSAQWRRSEWFPVDGAHFDNTLLHCIRLAQTASPPQTSAGWATIYTQSRLALVTIDADAAYINKQVFILARKKVIYVSTMNQNNGRALHSVYIPENDDISGIAFGADRFPLVVIPRDSSVSLRLKPVLGRSHNDSLYLSTFIEPSADEYYKSQLDIIARDNSGNQIKQTSLLGDTLQITLSKGSCSFLASSGDFPMVAQTWWKPRINGIDEWTAHARKMLSNPEYEPYRGRIANDLWQLQNEYYRTQWDDLLDSAEFAEDVSRIAHDPAMIGKLRGVQRWAYLSRVDSSGQPFEIGIPLDYDKSKKYPLEIYLHAESGNYTMFEAKDNIQDKFYLSLLGRSRTHGFTGLVEVDALEAIEYVCRYWNIDRRRIHISGTGTGGNGALTISLRHPDLYASVSSYAGYSFSAAAANFLQVPVWAVHSRDDKEVPICIVKGLVDAINEAGGSATLAATNGMGQNIHRNDFWEQCRSVQLKRIAPESFDRFAYTATDEGACSAYWARIVEWGPRSRPARIAGRIVRGTDLRIDLDNVATAGFDLRRIPVDGTAALSVSVNGGFPLTVSPPLPDSLYVKCQQDSVSVSAAKPAAPAFRLHFPGGMQSLYHGEPVMVVWGTRDENREVTKRIFEVAQLSRRSKNGVWQTALIDQMSYGRLPGKPDTAITRDDMRHYNLVLIGTARQNKIVAQIADKLPVRLTGKDLAVAEDGVSWQFSHTGLGLLYYNPLSPQRYVYWIAGSDAEFYRSGTALMKCQEWMTAAPDLLLCRSDSSQIIAARKFDSHWRWEPGYAQSSKLPALICGNQDWINTVGQAIQRMTGADFYLAGGDWRNKGRHWRPGETRVMDALACSYDEAVATITVSGRDIRDYLGMPQSEDDARWESKLLPFEKAGTCNPAKEYLIALMPRHMRNYASLGGNAGDYRLTKVTVGDALAWYLNGY
jgi:hypothetical protein